jgi:hypothetical protein
LLFLDQLDHPPRERSSRARLGLAPFCREFALRMAMKAATKADMAATRAVMKRAIGSIYNSATLGRRAVTWMSYGFSVISYFLIITLLTLFIIFY